MKPKADTLHEVRLFHLPCMLYVQFNVIDTLHVIEYRRVFSTTVISHEY